MKPMFMMQKVLEKCAEHFEGDAAHHGVMAKAWEDDSEQQASHNERGEACSKLAKTCRSLADKCDKAEDIADLEKLFGDKADEMQPSEIVGVLPDAPVTKGRPVPRFGAPAIAIESVDKEFRKLVSIEDGTETETA